MKQSSKTALQYSKTRTKTKRIVNALDIPAKIHKYIKLVVRLHKRT